jgi:DNA repair exonuclease SbcCD ATPase subunit
MNVGFILKTLAKITAIVLLTSLISPASAQLPVLNPGDGDEGKKEFEVEIGNVITSRDEAERLLTDELGPAQQKIQQTFTDAVQNMGEKLMAVRANPNDAKHRAAYEASVTEALTQAGEILNSYAQLGPKTIKALDQLEKTIDGAKTLCEGAREDAVAEVEGYAASISEIEGKLASLASEQRELIEAGKPLPLEVEFEVDLLQTNLETLQLQRQLAELDQIDMQDYIADLMSQEEEVKRLRNALVVSFHRAVGQQTLVTRVAEIRGRKITAAQMRDRLQRISSVMPGLNANIAEVGSLIRTFVEDSKSVQGYASKARSRGKSASSKYSGNAVDALKPYLKPTSESTPVPNPAE